MRARAIAARLGALGCVLVTGAGSVRADSTAGIDSALFRSAYDANGIFAVEGARLLPPRDLSLKVLLGYGRAPITVTVPGIGGATNTDGDPILDHVLTLDMAFGLSLSTRVAMGIDVAAYRASPGAGYGVRGRYGTGGVVAVRSTGLLALRPLSNIDPSASPDDRGAYLGDERAGPLDARFGLKLGLVQSPRFALALVGTAQLPFGEDEMLLGDRDVVIEPALAAEVRPSPARATRLVANVTLRLRKRTVLESYDAADPTQSAADAVVMLDVGGEAVLGVGGTLALGPRLALAGEAQAFVPVSGASYGGCHRANGDRCSAITAADYAPGAGAGDRTTLVTGGALMRVSPDVTVTALVGTAIGGARGDELRVNAGLTWAPQVAP